MQRYLNENDTVSEIRLASRHPDGKSYIWLLVEGITDQKLYAKLVDGINTKVEMVHGGGITKLREVMQILVQENNKVIGIRDADFLHLDGQVETIAGLFLTDVHDAEIMLLSCDTVFQHLLVEHLPSASSQLQYLRENLLSSLVFLGGIRWLNHTGDLKLSFKSVGLADFYDSTNLILDKPRCIANIEARSPTKKCSIDISEIDAKITGITDHYNLCNGHDAVKALALHITAKNSKNIKDAEIERTLRIAYRKEDFATTRLYAALKNWEQNTGLQLFK